MEPPGDAVAQDALRTSLARGMVAALETGLLPWHSLVEVRRDPVGDIVVLDVQPERPQDLSADIRRVERIAIRVPDGENRTPEVFALRSGFPDVPHLNATPADCPWPSLCLYEEGWRDLRLHLTPPAFLRRIHEWLSGTADGSLHHADQPLEPFLAPSLIPLVLPPSIVRAPHQSLTIRAHGDGVRSVLVAATEGSDGGVEHEIERLALTFRTPPARPGALRRHPANLADLHDKLSTLGFDLLAELRTALLGLFEQHQPWNESHIGGAAPILVILIPLLRGGATEPETEQVAAYHLRSCSITRLGTDVGIWSVSPDRIVGRLLAADVDARGDGVVIDPLRPVMDVTSEDLARLSGIDRSDLAVTAVGAGALGSQVVLTLARGGFGRWTVIDDDSLLPHNLARHALPRGAIGYAKAEATALFARVALDQDVVAIVDDVLGGAVQARDAVRGADLLIDTSASATVARWIACDAQRTGRAFSLFMNSTGTDVVLLAEDEARRCSLDILEMQYYRALSRRAELSGHMTGVPGGVRYGVSCRDVTLRIPQEQVVIAAGIGARAVRTASASPEPTLAIWRMTDELEVSAVRLETALPIEWSATDWTVVADELVVRRLRELRQDRLPNETGGILVGFHDIQRRRVYIADVLPAPPDSTERPVYFERGAHGLREAVDLIEVRTGGGLSYVGEWHSHPGRSTAPSRLDEGVFEHLARHMARDGHPPLMVIVGESGLGVFAGELSPAQREAPGA